MRRWGEGMPKGRNAREKLLTLILANPGLHLREIARRYSGPLATVNYHLNWLEHEGFVLVRQDGPRSYKRYYIAGSMGRVEKDVLSVLQHEMSRRIIEKLLVVGSATQRQLFEALGVSRSTMSILATRMLKQGVLVRLETRPERHYQLADPDLVRSIFECYGTSLRQELVSLL